MACWNVSPLLLCSPSICLFTFVPLNYKCLVIFMSCFLNKGLDLKLSTGPDRVASITNSSLRTNSPQIPLRQHTNSPRILTRPKYQLASVSKKEINKERKTEWKINEKIIIIIKTASSSYLVHSYSPKLPLYQFSCSIGSYRLILCRKRVGFSFRIVIFQC